MKEVGLLHINYKAYALQSTVDIVRAKQCVHFLIRILRACRAHRDYREISQLFVVNTLPFHVRLVIWCIY